MLEKSERNLRVVVRNGPSCTSPPFLNLVPVPDGRIDEVLRDEIPTWIPKNPVILDLPTGSGKTSIIYRELLPRISRNGQHLLIVSNRVALSTQQKIEIMKYFDDPRLKQLTPEGIRQQEDFGPVRVITYHRLPALLKEPGIGEWLQDLAYVIFDEAHFFAADAQFNPNCDRCLELAANTFQYAVRIYMTATVWDVLEPLAEAEAKAVRHQWLYPLSQQILFREGIHYYREGNYEDYRLTFFHNPEDLIPEIKNDPGKRWLIFVDRKEVGLNLKEQLGKQAAFLDAAQKSGPVWEQLVLHQKFETQVLVSTSVIDCGINILDDSLSNIVLLADDRVSFIQMLGRKRRKPYEKVHLWVQDLSRKTLAARCQQCENRLEWYRRVENCMDRRQRMAIAKEIWKEKDPMLFNLFTLGKGDLYPNKLARHVIQRREHFYEEILSGRTTFRAEVEKWLGIPAKNDRCAAAVLDRFYYEHKDELLDEGQQAELRRLIVQFFMDAGFTEPQRKRCAKLGPAALSNRLEALNIPYVIDDAGGGWMIRQKTAAAG